MGALLVVDAIAAIDPAWLPRLSPVLRGTALAAGRGRLGFGGGGGRIGRLRSGSVGERRGRDRRLDLLQ